MDSATLDRLAAQLEAAGLAEHARELREARAELAYVEAPPTRVGRLSARVRAGAARQWKHAVGELRESRTAWALIQKRLRGGEQLTPEEADQVRSQVLDVLKMLPASVIAAATAAVPVPGAMLASPWVLQRLGLMPSRWREANALQRLRRQRARLAELGRDEAQAIGNLIDAIEDQADRRDAAARADVLLAHWDADGDGEWDDAERDAYEAERDRLAEAAVAEPEKKRWFLQSDGHVVGPLRWTEVPRAGLDPRTLVCQDATSGWIALHDLLPRAPLPAPPPAGP